MKNKTLAITAVLFIISIVTYFGIISNGSIRAVEFISILAIGILAGVLLVNLFKNLSINKNVGNKN